MPPTDGVTAGRAPGARPNDGLATGQAIDNYVQKAANHKTEERGQNPSAQITDGHFEMHPLDVTRRSIGRKKPELEDMLLKVV